MEDIQLLFNIAVIILIIGSLFYLISRIKNRDNLFQMTENPNNKRNTYRLEVQIMDAIVEVTKIGGLHVSKKYACEIIDLSISGVGLYSNMDYLLNKDVLVKVYLKLNDKEFAINGQLVRKIQEEGKPIFLYGVNFINLSPGDENRLIKEIVAIDNKRRRITIN